MKKIKVTALVAAAAISAGAVTAAPMSAQAANTAYVGSCTTTFKSPITGHKLGREWKANVGLYTNRTVSGVAIQAPSHVKYKVGGVPFVFYFNKKNSKAQTIVPGRSVQTNKVLKRLPGTTTLEQRQVKGRPTHVVVVWDAWTNYSGPGAKNRKVGSMSCNVRLSQTTKVPLPKPSPQVSPR